MNCHRNTIIHFNKLLVRLLYCGLALQNLAIMLRTVAGPLPMALATAVRLAFFGLVLMFDFVVISICVFRQIIVLKVGEQVCFNIVCQL